MFDTAESVGEWEEAAVSEELSSPLTASLNAGHRMSDTNKSQARQAQNSLQKRKYIKIKKVYPT
jgi:hypothetical protein